MVARETRLKAHAAATIAMVLSSSAGAGGDEGWSGSKATCWGANVDAQCNVPAKLGFVTAIAARARFERACEFLAE